MAILKTVHTWLGNYAILASAMLAFGLATPAQAQEAAEIGRLVRTGNLEEAMKKADACLAAKPRDAQCRFLKGLIFTEQGKSQDAITVFTRLTEDFPELPEPYNNLAVLYAGQGNYERARQSLEMAIRTHPSYATAYENLGDVYAKLASQAYDKALSLDGGNATAQSKLSVARQLIGGGTGAVRPTAGTVAVAATPPKGVAASAPPVASPPPAATPAGAPASAAVKPADPPKAATPAAAAGNDEAEVMAAINAWVAAWSKQDVNGYLASYAADFKPWDGLSRKAWAAQRKQRIEAPKSISVSIEGPKVTLKDGENATVKFRQNYASEITKSSNSKTMIMVKSGGKWLIQEERSGG
jgi:ketosteroid isomerase-like protein